MMRSIRWFVPTIIAVFVAGSQVSAQDVGTIQGLVVDAQTGEALVGATVAVLNTSMGGMTNVDGRFTL